MQAASNLTDAEWAAIMPLFPKVRGIPRADDRRVMDGILWRLRTGASWESIPPRYGRPTTCRSRFSRWRDSGVWDRIVEAAASVHGPGIAFIDAAAANVPPTWRKRADDADRVAWEAIVTPAQPQAA